MDPLDRFSAALAAEHDGEVATPGVTRSRIVERLAKRRAPRTKLRALWAIPLVMLGAGTALAASGHLPVVLEPVTQWLTKDVLARIDRQPRKQSARALPGPLAPSMPAAAPAPAAEIDLAALESVPSESEELPPPMASRVRAHSDVTSDAQQDQQQDRRVRLVQLEHVQHEHEHEHEQFEHEQREQVKDHEQDQAQHEPAPARSQSAELGARAASEPGSAEPGLATYAAAQRAHFRTKDHGAAARLYRSYLEASPSGSFVTEARYNLSLCLLRLGRAAEARPLLDAFASGSYGSYRQLEARQLLDAITD
jgi:TolA-binding protein